MADKLTCENCKYQPTCKNIHLVSELIIETVSAATVAMGPYGLREALASIYMAKDKLEELVQDLPIDYEAVGGFVTGRGMEAMQDAFKDMEEAPSDTLH